MFRVKPEVHCKAVLAAELAGMSLNECAEEVLGKSAGSGLYYLGSGVPLVASCSLSSRAIIS